MSQPHFCSSCKQFHQYDDVYDVYNESNAYDAYDAYDVYNDDDFFDNDEFDIIGCGDWDSDGGSESCSI